MKTHDNKTVASKERVKKIQYNRTHHELHQALDGYHEQLITVYPDLQRNYPFNLALERRQYYHALCDLKRALRGLDSVEYQEIIRVLELAADKQFALE